MTNNTNPENAGNPNTQNSNSNNQSIWNMLFAQFTRAVDDTDIAAATARVEQERVLHPEETNEALIERLIRDKCARTAAIGAATSGAAIIPGIGTLASLTFGVAADIGATFKLQAELVLEIAAAHKRVLTNEEKRTVVMLITGMSSGANRLVTSAGQRATLKVTERYAQRWVTHALPFVGVAASAATNVLTTYLVGKRADAYFRLGNEAMGDWGQIWRAITGVNERAVGSWFASQANTSWRLVRQGAAGASNVIANTGKTVAGAVGSASDTVLSKANALASSAGTGQRGPVARLVDAVSWAGQSVQGRVRSVSARVRGFLKRKKAPKQLPDAPTPPDDAA